MIAKNIGVKKRIQDSLLYFKLLCKAMEAGKSEVQVKRSRKTYIIQIDEIREWIVCIKDFLEQIENKIVKDIFHKAFIEHRTEQSILAVIPVSRGSLQKIKWEITDKIYHLGIAKGLVDYNDILEEKINR